MDIVKVQCFLYGETSYIVSGGEAKKKVLENRGGGGYDLAGNIREPHQELCATSLESKLCLKQVIGVLNTCLEMPGKCHLRKVSLLNVVMTSKLGITCMSKRLS